MKTYQPTSSFTKIDNIALDKCMPYIGTKAYVIYSFYCRMVHRKKGVAYPSLTQTAERLGLGKTTIIKCNSILVECGLIEVLKGTGRMHNQYRPIKPNQIKMARFIAKCQLITRKHYRGVPIK